MKRPHFALPEIYDDSLSYYDVLRKLIKSMHAIVDNLNKIPEQIANEAKERLLGDQNLQQNINTEKSAREQADGTLQTNIDNEKQSREQADQEIREGMSNKISELKGDLTQCLKEPDGMAVGKYFRIAAIDENGHAVLEAVDAPQGGVTDVKANGVSVVNDGVANIPYGSWKSAGLVKSDSNYGTSFINEEGLLVISGASEDAISGRNVYPYTVFKPPISTSGLDYAVKSSMCDGKGTAWTDAERIAALLRMGCTVDDNGFVKWAAQEVTG